MVDAARRGAASAGGKPAAELARSGPARQRRTHAHRIPAMGVGSKNGMRLFRAGIGKNVAVSAAHAAAPRGVGKHEDLAVRKSNQRTGLSRSLEVAHARLAYLPENRLFVHEAKRIGLALEDFVHRGRMRDEVRFGIAVAVVIEAFAELLQRFNLFRIQCQRVGQPPCLPMHVVTERGDDGPDTMTSAKVMVHDDAGAGIRRRVDGSMQPRVNRNFARAVVIEILNRDTPGQQSQQFRPVDVERNVEHGYRVSRSRGHPFKQGNVALYPGHKNRVARRRKAQLVQGAKAVGIAVEDVKLFHGRSNRNIQMRQTTIEAPILDDNLALFALDASRGFGEQVAHQLGVSLAAHEEREFDDGEHKARPLVNVRGKDVFVIHSLYGDQRHSSNDKLCRLLFFIGALKDAAAERVTAIVPYLAYARKDRKSKARDPVTTRYVAAMFEAVGADAVLTMDVHNLAAFQNAFRCRTDHLEANNLFVNHFVPLLRDEDAVVVSPDAGGIKRAEHFRTSLARRLGKPVGAAFAEKHRSQDEVTGEMLVGQVRDRHAIIIDDMIATGTTIVRTARACREHGAAAVSAAASHGLFTGNANSVLAEDALQRIVVTDTVPPLRLPEGPVRSRLTVLDSTMLFAQAIRAMHGGGSITELLDS